MLLKPNREIKLSELEIAYRTYFTNIEVANYKNYYIIDRFASSNIRVVDYIIIELI